MVRDIDGQSYNPAPLRNDPGYHHYYVPHVEWYTAGVDGNDISNINAIKNAVMTYGALGTCYCAGAYGNTMHYQPESTTQDPNHSVAIVGWDDSLTFSGAPGPGGWLCKNSWGAGWNGDGHLWISYYDKHAGHHPEMGAVSFRGVDLNPYLHTYSHDYHGWRDTLDTVSEAFNAFTAESNDPLAAVSFYTAADNVAYTVTVYDTFDDTGAGALLDELTSETGTFATTGYHTVDLASPVALTGGDDFYIYLSLSDSGQPIDRTSDIPVLLSAPAVTDHSVVSDAVAGQSYYLDGSTWEDLHDLYLFGSDLPGGGREVTGSANFCIKGLTLASGQGVPEPPALILLMLGGWLVLTTRRCRKRSTRTMPEVR